MEGYHRTVMSFFRPRFVIPLCSTLAACGGDGAPAPQSKSIAQALEPPKKPEKPAEVPAVPTKKDPNVVEYPWSLQDVKSATIAGAKAVYKRTGTNVKGKKVNDELTYLVRSTDDKGAGTSYTISPDPGTNRASSQVANMPWTKLSPLFAMDNPEQTLAGRESITVPAGTFETVKVELKDFFGNKRTVWLVVDKPGVYAKIVDHGNDADEHDKTEIAHELVK